MYHLPLSIEHGTNKTVDTGVWPWLSGQSPSNVSPRISLAVSHATSPQSGINPPFSDPWFVLALARIWGRVLQSKATELDDLRLHLMAGGVQVAGVIISLSLFPSLSHIHTHTLSRKHSLSHPHTQSLSLSLSITHTHTP